MKVTAYSLGVLALIGIVAVGCTGVTGLTTLLGGGGARSVGDVATPGATEAPAGRPLASGAAIGVQVRNLPPKSADVTLRFFVTDRVVHLTLLRVPPVSTSVVIGPDRADRFTAGGVAEDGNSLPEGEFFEGIDFGDGTQAVYQIGGDPNEPSPGQDLPDGTPVNDDDVDDTPGANDPPQLVFLEPAEDQTVPLGSVVALVWRDADPDDDARIELALRSVESGGPRITLAPLIAEDPDGVNDRLRVVIENVSPGEYEVVGVIRDPVVAVEAVAPGRLRVVADPDNGAPELTILQPAADIAVLQDSSLAVAWSDADDGPAYITFYLDRDGVAFNSDDIQVSPPIAAEPDGAGADSGRVAISSVPVGEYSLLGVINDGEFIGTARSPGRVRVVARITPPPPSPSGQCATDADCRDSLYCNGLESCSGGRCYPGVPPCSFGQTCDESADTCVSLVFPCGSDEECSDGLFCNGQEMCGSNGRCAPGAAPCAFGQTCNESDDVCLLLGEECESNDECDDERFCNGQEVCDGACYPGSPPCDFGETCDEERNECVALLFPCHSDSECDDGSFCNGLEFCNTGGECSPGVAPCAFGEACDEEADVCHSLAAQCQFAEDCCDGVFCNGQEQCVVGVCVPGPWPCEFGETCSEATGCVPVTSTCSTSEECDDGIFCNGEEFCELGLCFPGTPPCYPGLLCDEAQQQCLAPAPIVIAATSESAQPGVVDVGSPYCIQYSLTNHTPLAGDQMRFFAIPLVTGPTVEIVVFDPPWLDGSGVFHVCVDFTPIDGILVNCDTYDPGSTSVFVELRLERQVGGVPTIVSIGRVKASFSPHSADIILGVRCPR